MKKLIRQVECVDLFYIFLKYLYISYNVNQGLLSVIAYTVIITKPNKKTTIAFREINVIPLI